MSQVDVGWRHAASRAGQWAHSTAQATAALEILLSIQSTIRTLEGPEHPAAKLDLEAALEVVQKALAVGPRLAGWDARNDPA
jgi:hypothetical protein